MGAVFACLLPWVCLLRTNFTRSSIIGMRANLFLRCKVTSRRQQYNFWPAFWIMTAGHELATTFADYDGKEEFDYGFDPLNLRPEDSEKELEYKTMELNHGRWAMFCAAGIIAQELVTGTSVI